MLVSDEQSKVHVGLQVLESALSGTTKKIFKSRYEEGYDVKDDELCSKLNELKLDGGKDNLEPTSKSKQYAAADSSQEVNEVFKQALVIPDQVPHKKTLRGSQKLPEHLSGDEAIAKMEDKIRMKQIEEKKKRKEERELKKLQKQKEKASKQIQKKTSKKRVATKTKKSTNDEDEICPVCCKNDPSHKWICCDICDTWYHIKCVNLTVKDCVRLKEVDWYCSGCVD